VKIAIISVCFLALIQTLLGLAVSLCRRKYKVSCGCPDDPAHILFRVRTAFQNCAEWHPLFMALMLVLPMAGSAPWTIWLNPLVVGARCLLVAGLVTEPLHKPNNLRVMGAAFNYVLALAFAALVLFSSLS